MLLSLIYNIFGQALQKRAAHAQVMHNLRCCILGNIYCLLSNVPICVYVDIIYVDIIVVLILQVFDYILETLLLLLYFYL